MKAPTLAQVLKTAAPTARESLRCMPWAADEYITVNDTPLVYTVSKRDGLQVRLPGGKAATVETLKAEGFDVRMPASIRLERFAAKPAQEVAA